MSRFADPAAAAEYRLPGPCDCPDKPHDYDWIKIRTELGAADTLAIAQAGSNVAALSLMAVEWNLLGADGQPVPLDQAHIDRLWTENFNDLDAWMDAHVTLSRLPKARARRSSTGTPASRRPTPLTRPRRRSSRS